VSGLFGSLSASARALDAQRFGMDVTGQNIANVNSPGYARREALLAPSPIAGEQEGMGGVDVIGVRATRDRLLESRLQMEVPAERRESAIADALSVVEVAIGAPGESIDGELDQFFNWASQLAADPTSSTLRREFVSAGERLAVAFQDIYSRLTAAQGQADANIRGGVDTVNSSLEAIAKLNAAIGQVGPDQATNQALFDQQKVAVDDLSKQLDIAVIWREDGGVNITTSSGQPLVLGSQSYTLTSSPQGPSGFVDIVSRDGQSVTADITGGQLGGYLHVRDALIPGYLSSLDSLATSVVTQVNQLHQNGYDAAGNPGQAFFSVTAGTNAASSMTVNANIIADPGLVAAGGSAVSGDNGNARAIAALRDADVGTSGSFSDAWSQLVYRVGSDTQAAQQAQTSRQEIVRQIQALREAVSGVSLDEEAMSMLRYQRAYEANARFFQAVDQSIETLMNMFT
jgi:flagellar hook-associated protein 1 FlgK